VVSSAGKLIAVAALTGVPIIVMRQNPSRLGDTDPALLEALEAALAAGASVTVVDKLAFDCFAEPQFVEALTASGRSQIIVAGMESHICIVQTVLAALTSGRDAHVVADACCSRAASNHERAMARMAAAGATITTSESAMYELVGAAGTDEFRGLLSIVKS
jgi:nicotinamidase-related amidase